MTLTELKALKGEQLRIAVAERKGWQKTNSTTHNGSAVYTLGNKRAAVAICNIDMQRGLTWLPNFAGSRDAITEAIIRRFACVDEQTRFSHAIYELLYRPRDNDLGMYWKIATASAEDLCRAFLAATQET